MGDKFGRGGRLLPDEEVVRIINVMETVALAALERGYDHMMRALEGENAQANDTLARRWFAVGASVGGFINARSQRAPLQEGGGSWAEMRRSTGAKPGEVGSGPA
jgi:hypothetical protein